MANLKSPAAGSRSFEGTGGRPTARPTRRAWQRGLGLAAAGAALVATFAAYLRPDVAFTLANQLWSCF